MVHRSCATMEGAAKSVSRNPRSIILVVGVFPPAGTGQRVSTISEPSSPLQRTDIASV